MKWLENLQLVSRLLQWHQNYCGWHGGAAVSAVASQQEGKEGLNSCVEFVSPAAGLPRCAPTARPVTAGAGSCDPTGPVTASAVLSLVIFPAVAKRTSGLLCVHICKDAFVGCTHEELVKQIILILSLVWSHLLDWVIDRDI